MAIQSGWNVREWIWCFVLISAVTPADTYLRSQGLSASPLPPSLEIILFLSGCDRADGLFNSVMNVVPETFSSAAGREDSFLPTSALFYAALIDYHEASSSLVITILISYRSRRRGSGSKVKFAQGWERWPEQFSMRSRQVNISFGRYFVKLI